MKKRKRVYLPEDLLKKVRMLKLRLPPRLKHIDQQTILDNLEIDIKKTIEKLKKMLEYY